MTKLAAKLMTLRSREEGATAVEYGVMVALIIAVVIAIVYSIGQEIQTAFQSVLTELQKP
ncbi:Flp family type IVb pilin [Intrasporangium calvum]|uniref:Flp family type IVb pilin n=1 Tax=Intrasporangium calvum TaxID=53358 RepID=UPI000DF613D5|nr:Flp family type IVb pilin [Intrasporangium calvum]AXG12321.1 Flp family type IVb pilin [Intrasporangium calvum]